MKATLVKRIACGAGILAIPAVIACGGTQQTPATFRPANKEFSEVLVDEQVIKTMVPEEYEVSFEIDVETITKRPVDLLFVIDNSSSMEPSQDKLRIALRRLAKKFLLPDTDIRIGAITTDVYLANPAFTGYRSLLLDGPHKDFPEFPNGVTFNDVHPSVGPLYAKLLPGIHDGPVVTLCHPIKGDFINGPSRCKVRDNPKHNQSPDNCIKGIDGIRECVNTVRNNSVRSGRAIIHTKAPEGQDAAKWAEQVVNDFIVNVSVGTSGNGSERGLESIVQFLRDNEAPGSESRLFRKDSLKIIVILSDEDDQSMALPENPPSDFRANKTGYSDICPKKKVDGAEYTLGTCVADENTLIPVPSYKQTLDSFFQALDGTTANYFVAPIVAKDGATIKKLHVQQREMQSYKGKRKPPTDQDIGARYIELAKLVGNGSQVFDIGASKYDSILDAMFKTLKTKEPKTEKRTRKVPKTEIKRNVRRQFDLPKDPMSPDQVMLSLLFDDGNEQPLHHSQSKVEGRKVTITDETLLKETKATRIKVRFQPRNAGPDSQ